MSERKSGDLYPFIDEPNFFGYLNVGDGHSVYFEECGNPKGVPYTYLHGGPGAGCDLNDRRFADPEKHRIILFDQRGCGRSDPYARTAANTTWHLLKDISRVLDYLKIEKLVVAGGSWGSTLALCFAINHPERILGIMLRGIWLADEEALKDYCRGTPNTRFPEIWKQFISHVPEEFRHNPVEYYLRKMISGPLSEREHFIYEMWYYENARRSVKLIPEEKLRKEFEEDKSAAACSILEAHYTSQRCFLEDGYILKNAPRIPNVPIIMVHGIYDDLCPVDQALVLHRALPQAELHVVDAGHSKMEPEIRKTLVIETERMLSRIKKS